MSAVGKQGNYKNVDSIMFLSTIFKLLQAVSITIIVAGCASFSCDELSDMDEFIPKSDMPLSNDMSQQIR